MEKLNSKEAVQEVVRQVLAGNGPEPLRLYFLDRPDDVSDKPGAPITFQSIDLDWFAGEVADAVLGHLHTENDGSLFVCEHCEGLFRGQYLSTADCNTTGTGVTVCEACCTRHDERLRRGSN